MPSLAWTEMPMLGGTEAQPDAWTSLLKVNAELFVSAPTRDRETIRTFESLALGFLPRMDHAALVNLARLLSPCEDTPTAILDHLIQHSTETRDIVFALSPRMSSSFVKRLLGTLDGRLTLAKRDVLDPFTVARLLVLRESAVEDALAANPALDLHHPTGRELMRLARRRASLARILLQRPDLPLQDDAALYLAADGGRRAKIRERIAAVLGQEESFRGFHLAEAHLSDLFALALGGDVAGFERCLSGLFGFPATVEWELLALGRHDLIPLALKALGLADKEATRVFMTLHPALSHSVSVTSALVRGGNEVSEPVALVLVEAILEARVSAARESA